MPVYSAGAGLNMLMYASDETQANTTTSAAYVLAKHLYIVYAPGYTPTFNKLLWVVAAANDTAAHNTYVAIYVESVLKAELTFAYAAGGVYTRQFAEIDISDWGAEEYYHVELKMKVDAGSTGWQWVWENWLKNLK